MYRLRLTPVLQYAESSVFRFWQAPLCTNIKELIQSNNRRFSAWCQHEGCGGGSGIHSSSWLLTTFCFVSLIRRDFQNWRLRSRSQTVGHPEEPARHELWQTEPLHTSVLQEGHHSKAGRVSQAGVPVRPPRIMDVRMDMCKICWTYWVYSGSDVNATALSFGLHSCVFVFICTDCLLNYALLPIMITIWLYCSFSCFVHVLRPQLSVVLIGKPAEQSAYSLNQTHFIL